MLIIFVCQVVASDVLCNAADQHDSDKSHVFLVCLVCCHAYAALGKLFKCRAVVLFNLCRVICVV